MENNIKEDLKQKIDADEGLKTKRNLLTIVSLILLAIQFSGAKVVEANTFILKLEFAHQEGIALLLVLSILFLLIRYYNYARPYHDALYKAWTSEMLREYYFYDRCQYSDESYGLIAEHIEDHFNPQVVHNEDGSWNVSYFCSGILTRSICYSWNDRHDHYVGYTNIREKCGWAAYFKTLGFEIKYSFSKYFTQRENLDVLSPYFLGVFSIASYVFYDEFQLFLTLFLR